MLRYAPRLVPPRTAPADALVLPLIEHPPPSPLGEHELIPEVAWMVERDGVFVHVPASERAELELMRGSSMLTMLDGELTNEVLQELPGACFATTGTYAAELLVDADHLTQLILGDGVGRAGIAHGCLVEYEHEVRRAGCSGTHDRLLVALAQLDGHRMEQRAVDDGAEPAVVARK